MNNNSLSSTHPICFRDQRLQAPKKFFQGTHRTCNPEETEDKIRSTSFQFGLTRHADITGLDRIGVPVTLAIRPNGMTLSVSSGKGLTKPAAFVSGYMEAYEIYSCETFPFSFQYAPYEEIVKEFVTPDLSDLPLKKNGIINKKLPMRWVLGWDLISQQEVALPLMAISLDYRLANQSNFFELNSFERTTNGVASGNHLLEAISSGIYEAIERDAITCHEFSKPNYYPPKICLDTLHFESIRVLLERLKKANINLELFDCTVDTDIYVFEALVYDALHRRQGVAKGFGAHLDPEVAMLRAITEAIQGRTVYISGARDDIFLSHFQLFKKFDAEKAIEKLKERESTIDARSYTSKAAKTFEEDIQILIKKIRQAGLSHIIVFDLKRENSSFSCVRVVIPGLEGYATSSYKMGRRAHRFRESKKGEGSMLIPSLNSWHSPAGVV